MIGQGVSLINEKVKKESAVLEAVRLQMGKVLIGQNVMIDRLLIGILGNGHILLEGVPGLAKTTAVRTLAQTIQAKFQRIQFTPDMLPADLIGTLIFDQRTNNLILKKDLYSLILFWRMKSIVRQPRSKVPF
jgi:MoxR-like ATPase